MLLLSKLMFLEGETANLHKSRYRVSDDHCFSLQTISGFTPISSGCFSGSTMLSKIIILAHGTQQGILVGWEMLNYMGFALYMQNYLGLRQAGLLSFKCCFLGGETFLEEFGSVLGAIRIGYMVAYRHVSITATFGNDVVSTASGDQDWLVRTNSNGTDKLLDAQRIKVVEGTHPTIPPAFSTRFWDI